MRMLDLAAQCGDYIDHRLVVAQPDGTYLEVDLAVMSKVMPQDGDNWSGVLVPSEADSGQPNTGERVIVLIAKPD
jgi:hypothetical protein